MIPQEELDRALARWKARQLGQELPFSAAPVAIDDAPIHDEPTRVASPHYSSQVETPQAEVTSSEVHLSDTDFEDHTHK